MSSALPLLFTPLSPPKTKTVEVPEPAPRDTRAEEEAAERAAESRRREAARLKKRGLATTLATGGFGLSGPADINRKTLG